MPRRTQARKPFQCPLCKIRFTRKQTKERHVLLIHQNERFECNLCEASYRQKRNLTTHLKQFHPGKAFTSFRRFASGAQNGSKEKATGSNSLFSVLATQATSGQRCLARSEERQEELRVTRRATYSRASRGDLNDVKSDEESGSSEKSERRFQKNDSMDRDQAARGDDVLDEAERNSRKQDHQTAGHAPETSTVSNVRLKLVFDLEYRAPD